jgi:hypothetical protein
VSDSDLVVLARAALEDEKRGTPGPWHTYETEADIGARGGFWYVNADDKHKNATVAEVGYGKAHGIDASIITAARSREPLLACGYLDMVGEIAKWDALHRAVLKQRDEAVSALRQLRDTVLDCSHFAALDAARKVKL